MSFQEEFKARTKKIGLETLRLVKTLPSDPASWVLTKQIIRSATSIGANYRAACRAKSTPDFINKLKTVEEETDETIFWLELLQDSGMISTPDAATLLTETSAVLAIVVTSIKTSRLHNYRKT